MNRVILKGRLTRDIELKYTASQEPKAYTMFGVAVADRFNKDRCDFVNCKAWGKTAEFLAKYFVKGQEILLEGRLEVTTNEKNGNKTTYTAVVTEQVAFCGSKSTNSTNVSGFTPPEDDDEDLPF